MIENTARRDPALHLLGSLSDRPAGYIEDMEAAGQQQLVNSDLLPVEANPADDTAWIALGFTLGEVVADDPLFRHAILPNGWSRKADGHAMWSNIVDERGIERVSIFYKAAFYDRRASASLVNVGRSVAQKAIYGDGEPSISWDVLTEQERAAARRGLDDYLAAFDRSSTIYGHRLPHVQALIASAP